MFETTLYILKRYQLMNKGNNVQLKKHKDFLFSIPEGTEILEFILFCIAESLMKISHQSEII